MTRPFVLACLAVFACACDDDAPSDAALDDEVPCEASYPSFTPGMSVMAGAMTVKLQSIAPSPPRQKVKNDWLLQVLDASGALATDIALAAPDSYMPVHRHHGNTPPSSAPGTEPGAVQLNDIDFIMRGPWQVIFDVQQGGAKVGTATFQICVE